MELCPTADDVWFKAMSLLQGTEVEKVTTRSSKGEDYSENPEMQDVALAKINFEGEGRNDAQIRAVFKKYHIDELLR